MCPLWVSYQNKVEFKKSEKDKDCQEPCLFIFQILLKRVLFRGAKYRLVLINSLKSSFMRSFFRLYIDL